MKLNKVLTGSFQGPATIRKFTSSQVYLFKNSPSDSDGSSEEELDVMELRARGKKQQNVNTARKKVGDVVLLEREVAEDDTLNKLALQYGCQVADIKRVNNFIQEQDLYAVKLIKIPVKVNGVLTEASGMAPASHSADLSPAPECRDNGADRKQIEQYFRGIDEDVKQAAQVEVCLNMDYCTEIPNTLPPARKERGSGADCGIQWWNAVFFMLLVGIVLPVFYIVYFKTQEPGGAAGTTTSNLTLPAINSSLNGAVTEHVAGDTHTIRPSNERAFSQPGG